MWPRRDVVGRREGAGREGFERADVDFAHRFAGAGADRGQVAGGDDRAGRCRARPFFARAAAFDRQIVLLDRLLQRQLLVFGALPGLAVQHVARADEGDGGDDAAGRAVALRQHDDLRADVFVRRGDHRGA